MVAASRMPFCGGIVPFPYVMMATRSSTVIVDKDKSGALDAMSLPSLPWHKEHFMVYARWIAAREGCEPTAGSAAGDACSPHCTSRNRDKMPKISAVRFNVLNSRNLKPAVSLKTRSDGPRNARNDDHERDEEIAKLAPIFQFIGTGAFDQTMSQGAEHNGN